MALSADLPSSTADLHSTANTTPYTTGSFTPTANSLMVIFCCTRGAATNVHTVTGSTTGTIDEAVSEFGTGSAYTASLHVVKVGSSPSATTISCAVTGSQTGAHIIPVCWTGYDDSGTALDAIVQTDTTTWASATSFSDTLASGAGASDNRPGCFVATAPTASTMAPRTNWTEIANSEGSFSSPTAGAHAQWRSDTFEQTYSASWTTSAIGVAIAYEVKAAVVVADVILAMAPYQAVR